MNKTCCPYPKAGLANGKERTRVKSKREDKSKRDKDNKINKDKDKDNKINK